MLTLLCLVTAWSPNFDQENLNLASFERVWQIIAEKHWDLEGTGVDWQAVHDQYLPEARKATDRKAIRKVMQEMIHELGQTHFGILDADRYADLDRLKEGLPWGTGDPGFTVRLVDDRVFAVAIRPDTAAAKHLPLGSEIISFKEKKMADVVATTLKAFAEAPQASLYINLTLNDLFSGPVADEFQLVVRKPGSESERSVILKWAEAPGQIEHLGNLPPVSFNYDARMLDGEIGYVAFNIWLVPLVNAFTQSMAEFKDARGLVIDIRGNSGGIGFLANSLAGFLVQERNQKLGTMTTLDSSVNFFIVPRPSQYPGPVAILMDGGSASTSEIFAAGLSDLNRVQLFGTRTAGAALPSVVEVLPNGDRFQYAIADYLSVGGQRLEGVGVEPHHAAPHTLESLARGQDEALEAAIEWINHQGDQP